MNLGFLFIFIIVQMGVNFLLSMIINTETIYGLIAFYMLSSLIISFFAAIMATPPAYRKDFFKHPGFHKAMLSYFVVFSLFDLFSIAVRLF